MGNLIHRSIRDKEKYIFFQSICKNKSYDLNVVEEKTGLTPLMTAVMFNNRTVGLSLMDRHKVNLEVVNPKDNKTALDYAIQFLVKWMLDRFPHPQPSAVAGELKNKRAVLTPEKHYGALSRNDETLVMMILSTCLLMTLDCRTNRKLGYSEPLHLPSRPLREFWLRNIFKTINLHD